MLRAADEIIPNFDPTYPEITRWDVQKFIDTESIPGQQYYKDRLKQDEKLTDPCVNVAKTRSGQFYKLDGHLRSRKWSRKHTGNGAVHHPKVKVIIWGVDDTSEAADLYRTFDSEMAIEGARDFIFNSLREFKTGSRKKDLDIILDYEEIGKFLCDILMDRFLMSEKAYSYFGEAIWSAWRIFHHTDDSSFVYCRPIQTSILLSIRYYGYDAVDFWKDHVTGDYHVVKGRSRNAFAKIDQLYQEFSLLKRADKKSEDDLCRKIMCVLQHAVKNHGVMFGRGNGEVQRLALSSEQRKWIRDDIASLSFGSDMRYTSALS